MNKASDMIFRLVKSLNPKEGADFRRSLSVYDVVKGKNNFLTLFDLLNGLTEYEEPLLRKKLPKTFKQSNLSSLKTQLKSKLMDFLIAHHTSDFQLIHRRLEEVEVLFTRGFYPEASIAVEEAKEVINQKKLRTYLFIATYFESCLVNYMGEKNVLDTVKNIAALNARVADELSLTYRLGSYLTRVIVLQTKGMIWRTKEDEKELKALLKHLTNEFDVPGITINQKILIHTSLLRLLASAMYYDEAFEHASLLHEMIFEIYDDFKHSDTDKFFSHITDIIGCALHAKRIEEGTLWLKDLEKGLKELSPSAMYTEFYEVLKYQLASFSKKPLETENAFKQLLTYYSTLGSYHASVQKEGQLTIALAYFKKKEYREADYYFYQMIEPAQSSEFFMEEYDFIRVLRLVTLYEQLFLPEPKKLSFESYRLQVNTVYQRIRKKPKDEDYRLEKIMLEFLRNVTGQTTKSVRKQMLLDMQSKLILLFKESPLYVKQISGYFNFLEWAESKIAGDERV